MKARVRHFGREHEDPMAKVFTVIAALGLVVALFAFGLIAIVLIGGFLGLMLLITIPAHFILRLLGRKGCYRREGRRHSWTIGSEAFKLDDKS